MQQISARELADWLAASKGETGASGQGPKPFLLDVREAWEYEHCHLAGALLMPMQTVPARLGELDASAEIVVICHHGVRSRQVAAFLEGQGFASLYNLAGGVDAWAHDADPAMPTY